MVAYISVDHLINSDLLQSTLLTQAQTKTIRTQILARAHTMHDEYVIYKMNY